MIFLCSYYRACMRDFDLFSFMDNNMLFCFLLIVCTLIALYEAFNYGKESSYSMPYSKVVNYFTGRDGEPASEEYQCGVSNDYKIDLTGNKPSLVAETVFTGKFLGK
jgi:hypothetical protein